MGAINKRSEVDGGRSVGRSVRCGAAQRSSAPFDTDLIYDGIYKCNKDRVPFLRGREPMRGEDATGEISSYSSRDRGHGSGDLGLGPR